MDFHHTLAARLSGLFVTGGLLASCIHPLDVIGEGDLISDSGARNCVYEDALVDAPACSANIVLADYDETYTATPRAGWHFFAWQNYCVTSGFEECSFSFTAEQVVPFWGAIVPPLVAEFHQGTELNWNPDENAAAIIAGPTSYSVEAGGITATIAGYTAEWDGADYNIVGPFPTKDRFSIQTEDGLVISSIYDGVMLEVGDIGGLDAGGAEFCSGGGCGFDNSPYNPSGTLKSNFALITFSEPVDLGVVAINDISNFDQDVFLASGFAAPNLGQPLELAIASYDRSVHNLSGGRFTMEGLAPVHSNLRYLVIGAPVDPSTGVLSDVRNPDTSDDTFVVQKVIVRPAQ